MSRTRCRAAANLTLIGVATAALVVTLPIPAAADSVTTTIPVGLSPNWIALAPDGIRLYVANRSSDDISVIDTTTDSVIDTIAIGDGAMGLAFTPDGSRLYATNQIDDTVSVIDTTSNDVVATIPVGDAPTAVTVSPDGGTLFVASADSDDVSIVDTGTGGVTATIPVGREPIDIVGGASALYTADYLDRTITVIDPDSGSVSTSIALDVNPFRLALSPDGSRLWATSLTGVVTVIDTASNAIVQTVDLGETAFEVAFSPDGRRAYVSMYDSGAVQVIDPATGALGQLISVGTSPTDLAIASDGRGYVSSLTPGAVTVFALDEFPALPAATLPDARTGAAYTAAIPATGSPAPEYAVTGGALPPGLELDSESGELSGTPTAGGEFTFTVAANAVVSGLPSTVERDYTITVVQVLPATGVEPGLGILAGAALLVAGLAVLRRRVTTGPSAA